MEDLSGERLGELKGEEEVLLGTEELADPAPNLRVMYCRAFFGFGMRYRLKPIDLLVISLIEALSNNSTNLVPGWCYLSQENFAKCLSVDVTTIHASLNRLLKKGLLRRSRSSYPTVRWMLSQNARETLDSIKKDIDSRRKRGSH